MPPLLSEHCPAAKGIRNKDCISTKDSEQKSFPNYVADYLNSPPFDNTNYSKRECLHYTEERRKCFGSFSCFKIYGLRTGHKLHLNSKGSINLPKNTSTSPAQMPALQNSYFMFLPVAPSPTRDKLTSSLSTKCATACSWFYFNVCSAVFILHRNQQVVIMILTHVAMPAVQHSSIS